MLMIEGKTGLPMREMTTMDLSGSGVFALAGGLAEKADPALIAADEQHFAAVAAAITEGIATLSMRLEEARRAPAGHVQQAWERDQDIHRMSARLRTLQRYGIDLCLGRMVPDDGSAPVYIGRVGLSDAAGRRLLVDWRSKAAAPFFGATHARPAGLISRRRYRWAGGRVTDYWDEVFTPEGLEGNAALDHQSAFLASLATHRTPRMQDVLGTIQADQDAVIRAGSHGTLVVDGGPGTGKTVVALHRAAYLLYSDPHVGDHRGGVLFIGPHQPYLAYVADILPGLGEEGVRTCTLRDLVPEGATAGEEADPDVAKLKAGVSMGTVVEAAVRFWEDPPTEGLVVETASAELWLGPEQWAEACAAPDPGTPHNEGYDQVWEALLSILVDQHDGEDDPEQVRAELEQSRDLRDALDRAWTLVEPTDLVGDLWSVPAYLHRCAPWLTRDEVALLQRPEPQAWTVSDLPLLDAARRLLGDPEASRRARRARVAGAVERARTARVVDDLIAADDGEGLVTMLVQEDLRDALVDPDILTAPDPDALAGPFAHVVIDEAQELTDAEWRMVLDRCPSRSVTVVGDRAQARNGFPETWTERLTRIGLDRIEIAALTINYRTPAEIMAEAEPVIRAVLPDANVPTSVRSTGVPVRRGSSAEARAIVDLWTAAHPVGTACVIGDPGFAGTARVRSLTPELAKGLEFDLVVLVDPDGLGNGVAGAVDRYVAMTRATQELVVLTPP